MVTHLHWLIIVRGCDARQVVNQGLDFVSGSVWKDITDRGATRTGGLATDPALLHSMILASVGQAVIAASPDRNIFFWNRAAEELFGWTAEEVIGKSSSEVFLHGESALRSDEILGSIARDGTWSGDLEAQRRDGSRLWVFATTCAVRDPKGVLIAYASSAIDVSARRAEDAARRQLSAIVDSSADAIFGVTIAGQITSWNRAAETLFGYTAEEAVGQTISMIAPAELHDEQLDARSRLTDGSPFEVFETTRALLPVEFSGTDWVCPYVQSP